VKPGIDAVIPETAASIEVPGTHRERYLFIDLFRTIIILLMLEGHVLRQFLDVTLKGTMPFEMHEILHGITAPAFLFGAGLTFVISSHRRWSAYHRWGDELERRMRRIVMIFLLGIFLHLPYLSFRKTVLETSTRDLLVLFQSDVLTCISIGLLTLHLLLFFVRSEDRFQVVVVVLTALTVFLTPIVWQIDFLDYTPLLLAQLSNSLHGSPFPLFPFAAYLFAGVAVSRKFLVAVASGTVPQFMGRLAYLGLAVLAGGAISAAVPYTPYPVYDFWYTSPSYFFIRLGFLMIAFAGVWKLGEWFSGRWRGLLCLGKESLLVYILHLLVLYGSVINSRSNLTAWIPPTLGLAGALGIFIALTVVMFGAAFLWNLLKTTRPGIYRTLLAGIGIVILYVFFTRDY